MSVFNTSNLEKNSAIIEDKPLIMIVDDEQENINALRLLLESKYKIITGLNGKDALDMIDTLSDPHEVKLIISDQQMPHMNGVEFFEEVAEKLPDTIRIILTGYSDINVIVDSINKAQIFKFITKPFEPAELNLTIRRGIETYEMRQELIRYTQKLEEMVEERTNELKKALADLEKASLTDQLTGAYNRRFVDQFIEQELSQTRRAYFDGDIDVSAGESRDIGFILIDADNFKSVNDNFGHEAGDKVLMQITQILQDSCRESDWVVRWGGEEFLLVCLGSDLEGTLTLAERVRDRIEHHNFDIGNGQTLKRTCSMGTSVWPYSHKDVDFLTWEQTLHLADVALYLAKNNGKNAWMSVVAEDEELSDSYKQSLLHDTENMILQGKLETLFSRKATH